MVAKRRAVPASGRSARSAASKSPQTKAETEKLVATAAGRTALAEARAEERRSKAAERAAAHLAQSLEADPTSEDEEIRAMVLGALREVGGREFLVGCARDLRTRNTFLNLCARVGQRSDASLGAWSGTININTGVRRG